VINTKPLKPLERGVIESRLKNDIYDLLVVGGGVTGAGIALDAASRGLKVALIEKNDFASGTSSRSTKLIHGGLRYLKQFEIALVREVGRERAIVHHLAPHLVRSEKMLLPLIKGGTYGKIATSLGLMVYDVLAGVESADQRKMLSIEKSLEAEPLLDPATLEGAGIYAEYRTDDARLTMEIIKAASAYGADCLNYVEALSFNYEDEEIIGANVKDHITGAIFDVESRFVVSATGPWVDDLRKKDESLEGKRLHLTKGVHIVFDREKLPVKQSVYFDVPDGRMIFAIPRGKVTYVGTTDTDYTGDKDHVLTNRDDVKYLLDAVNSAFPSINLTIDDVESSWAGLRPLIHEDGKSASELSRKDEIFESESGLISIAGGKLTGYRKMSERVVDLVGERMEDIYNRHADEIHTREIALGGEPFAAPDEVNEYQAQIRSKLQELGYDGDYEAWYLTSNYGKQSDSIVADLAQYPPGELSLLKAECEYCAQYELIETMSDFFIRRTGRLYFDIHSVKNNLNDMAEFMRQLFDWDEDRVSNEIQEMEREIREVSVFG
jgi:glycerol-3-phosphate dehydrogenase